MDFNNFALTPTIFGTHSCQRLERLGRNTTREQARKSLENGMVVLQTDKHRYIKSDNVVFPIVRENGFNVVKTILTDEMHINPI